MRPNADARRIPAAGPTDTVLALRGSMIFALDLEGVLAPEIWPILGTHFDLPELSLTTRDLGDFDELMRPPGRRHPRRAA